MENLNQTVALIQKDFTLEASDLPASIDSMDKLRIELNKVVSYLLDKDFNRLLNALYRIDVSEAKVKLILSEENPERLSLALTDLIIKRELKKIETRKKYGPS
ncbi:MAG TPA: hypothetical protein PKL31_07410 [Fulvivirga sp.]|nr:hypothetical protein [Fulvivirga sp.]